MRRFPRRIQQRSESPGLGMVAVTSYPNHYYLRDDFTDAHAAGALNLTVATDGNTPRRVTDPDSKMQTTGGVLRVGTTSVTSADYRPGISYTPFIRSGLGQGMILFASVVPNAGRGPDYVGWYMSPSATAAGPWGNEYSIRFVSGGIYAGITTGSSAKLADYVGGTTYTVAVIIKAVGGEIWIKGGAWAVWTKLHTDTALADGYYAYPTSSYYLSGTAATSDVDWIMVCPYRGFVSDLYLAATNGNRASHNVCLLGDSKSTTTGVSARSLCVDALSTVFDALPGIPGNIAIAGATWSSRAASSAADFAASVGTPELLMINLGTNDTDAMPVEATLKADVQTIVDNAKAKWAGIKILIDLIYNSSHVSESNTLDGWLITKISDNPGVCYQGIDERVVLPGYMVDDRHPTVPVGYQRWSASRRVAARIALGL